ncbi:MAG: DUF5362 family protein, partial [candidate division WOR-3 bacterium]
ALSVFGKIIAWLPIWLGVILLKASNSTGEVGTGKIESLGDMMGSLKTFFIVSGVFMIISIVFSIIWLMVMGFAMLGGFLGETGGFY